MLLTPQCCVPHCKRTTARTEYSEWVCGDHWKGLPRTRRRAYTRAKKRALASVSETDLKCADRLWHRLKATAIERAVGI